MKEVGEISNKLDVKSKIRHNEKKHRDFAMTHYQNVIDSYNIVDEDMIDYSLTNKMLYQLEWDVTCENRKPLPRFLKNIIGFLMFCGTIMSLEYSGQTGGQLSITQIQEWVACYLISLLLYGLFVEPLFALLLGVCQVKNRNVS